VDGPLFIIPPMCYTMVSNLKEDEMSISLAGDTQAQADCIHHWDIVGIHDINPATEKPYGVRTPGKCRKCGKRAMFNSKAVEHTKDSFIVGAPE